MKHGATVIGIAAIVAACSSPDSMGEDIGVGPAAVSQEDGKTAEPKEETGADRELFSDTSTDENAEREFSYAWPREVSAIPELAAELTVHRRERLDEQKRNWRQALADCPPEFTSCRNHSYAIEWRVVADTPRFLSLSNGDYSYTGGAHGNYGRGALVWDRKAGASLDPQAFFLSPSALDRAIGQKACSLLNAERAERRGEPVPEGETEWPNQCVSMEETVVFLGSSNGETFDRIGVYYAPYVAGAYAEGDFEFTLPVTEAVIAAVKPEYRAAFALGK
ncbi:PdaC/SigV domain-containing protein [Erythrobacter sp. THAF29]|uniref:DUF3298 and DUF4163 domain-containing protein n=1 Tax=Erythrobacter sp. THAF29 TaxID=2587851 RepID=UPI001268178F|nr:DUF4163 domain-containing protein [Erythrobacter sp. THAF29]QFT77048.1 hypothetical protein FIU90_05795 [Erythrobacter sp. THAF29]